MTDLIVEATENLTMDSLEISKLTKKEHWHIRRDIENMLQELELDVSKFGAIYFDWSNRKQKKYNLTKELTLTLISWYNVKLRKAIIDRWLELEKPKTWMSLVLDSIKFLETEIVKEKEKSLQLQTQIEKDKPVTDFWRAISQSAGTVKIWDWIKAITENGDLKIWRNKAFKWFREKGYLMKDNNPMQRYIDQWLFEVKEWMVVTDRKTIPTFTTLLTWKWQMYFSKKIREYLSETKTKTWFMQYLTF